MVSGGYSLLACIHGKFHENTHYIHNIYIYIYVHIPLEKGFVAQEAATARWRSGSDAGGRFLSGNILKRPSFSAVFSIVNYQMGVKQNHK